MQPVSAFQYEPTRRIPKDPNWFETAPRLAWHHLRRTQWEARYAQEARGIVVRMEALAGLSDVDLQGQVEAARQQAARRQMSRPRERLYEALAGLGAVATRQLGQTPYPVQLMAALAMLDGYIVQVAPGEGKTLTLALAAVIRGWEPGPCHLITANEYLAARDAEFLQPLYAFCGLEAVALSSEMSPEEKHQAYAKPIVYATAKQVIADHLIDRVRFGGVVDRIQASLRTLRGQPAVELMQRGLQDVLVDEADQILIDEAITPMIISEPEPNPGLKAAVEQAHRLVDALKPEQHYRLVPGQREVIWLETGQSVLAKLAEDLPVMWRSRGRREDLFTQAILARDRFIQDHHYVVLDDQVVIVDEGTGRSMPGRTWSYGLHQAIETRAGVPVTDPSRTLARLSFQNFFKLYRRLAGASGTLQDVDRELFFNYRVYTLRIPPRVPSRMRIHPVQIANTRIAKRDAVVACIRALQAQHRAVLVGTRNVADSEFLAEALAAQGFDYQLLNAKHPALEAEIVSAAGAGGKITVATNMAGRGTDIKLSADAAAAGGLCVIMFEPHESIRVDWQLYGRTARQGQPGEVFRYASLEDELIKRNLPKAIRWLARLKPQVMIRLAQQRAERRSFGLRKRINRATLESQKRMTFTDHA